MTTSTVPYQGLWPALLTPLDAKLNIDIAAFARHSLSLLDAGCAGVTPFGTTGEGPSFSVAERMAAIDGLIAGGVPAGRILVSASCAAIPDAVALTLHAVQAGAFGVLLLPPFFLKGVPDQGVIDAYSQIIDQVADPRLRVVLYHIPQISGVALSHAAVQTLLARYPQTIIGIKDSGCKQATSLEFAAAFMPPLQVWVGNEPDLQVMAAKGSVGAVSGVGNVLPLLLQRLIAPIAPNSALQAENIASARAARDLARVKAFIDVLSGYGMTAAFKGIMALQNNAPGWRRVRAPLVALSDAEFGRLSAQWAAFGLDRTQD